MPTQSKRKRTPKPMKSDATREISSSLYTSRVYFVDVTSYTKNQAVKNMPMASNTTVRWGNTAGFTGLVYLVIASNSIV